MSRDYRELSGELELARPEAETGVAGAASACIVRVFVLTLSPPVQ